MPSPQPTRLERRPKPARKLRVHLKSRRGCRNCKLRKVKCDETRPRCQKCRSYGTFCNYDPHVSDLKSSADGAIDFDFLRPQRCPENRLILSAINAGSSRVSPTEGSLQFDGMGYQFSSVNLELLHKFHTRTLATLGSTDPKQQHTYRRALEKLTYSHSFLFHIVVTLTLLHDRHLGVSSGIDQSLAIPFHWSQGASILNSKITAGVKDSERDALWTCAYLLGTLSFASFHVSTPYEAWPLKPSSLSDLDWLKLSQGKKEIWKIADPLREDSVFHPIAPDFLQYQKLAIFCVAPDAVQDLPLELVRLCNIDNSSTVDNNPYFATASVLAQLVHIECNGLNISKFMCFFGSMHEDFRNLLGKKDPCAMLLVAYWYAKMCSLNQWWIGDRAFMECRAICIYLKTRHNAHSGLMRLVEYPATMCDLYSISPAS